VSSFLHVFFFGFRRRLFSGSAVALFLLIVLLQMSIAVSLAYHQELNHLRMTSQNYISLWEHTGEEYSVPVLTLQTGTAHQHTWSAVSARPSDSHSITVHRHGHDAHVCSMARVSAAGASLPAQLRHMEP